LVDRAVLRATVAPGERGQRPWADPHTASLPQGPTASLPQGSPLSANPSSPVVPSVKP
jgi:hypothetical protein